MAPAGSSTRSPTVRGRCLPPCHEAAIRQGTLQPVSSVVPPCRRKPYFLAKRLHVHAARRPPSSAEVALWSPRRRAATEARAPQHWRDGAALRCCTASAKRGGAWHGYSVRGTAIQNSSTGGGSNTPYALRGAAVQVVGTAVQGGSAERCASPSARLQPLVDWVLRSGGFMHPALAAVDDAPCGGGSGLVWGLQEDEAEDEEGEEADSVPMLLVPEDLLLTSEVARYGFAAHFEPRGAPPLAELDEASQLAVMLTHEVLERDASFYAPYVSTLPAAPPCAWSMDRHQLGMRLESLLPRLGEEGVQVWREEVLRYRRAMERHAEGAEERYGRHFPVTAEGFFWSMGHVLSRSFSSHPSLALMPLIDLCNHQAGSDHPELVALGGDENDRCCCVSLVTAGGQRQHLRRGQELFIRYHDAVACPPAVASGPVTAPSPLAPPGRPGLWHLQNDAAASVTGVAPQSWRQAHPPPGISPRGIPQPAALMCFLSHGHVFQELWESPDPTRSRPRSE